MIILRQRNYVNPGPGKTKRFFKKIGKGVEKFILPKEPELPKKPEWIDLNPEEVTRLGLNEKKFTELVRKKKRKHRKG